MPELCDILIPRIYFINSYLPIGCDTAILRVLSCRGMWWFCYTVLYYAVLCCAILCSDVRRCAVLYCDKRSALYYVHNNCGSYKRHVCLVQCLYCAFTVLTLPSTSSMPCPKIPNLCCQSQIQILASIWIYLFILLTPTLK